MRVHRNGRVPINILSEDRARAPVRRDSQPATGNGSPPGILRYLIDLAGADRMVLGSDYDQDMQTQRPVQLVEKVPGRTGRERELILVRNAQRLLWL